MNRSMNPIPHFDATERRKQKMRRAAEERNKRGTVNETDEQGANGALEPSKQHDQGQSRTSVNATASELNAFLTELHQYVSESSSGGLVRFPTLSRVVSFLEKAQSLAHEASGSMSADRKELENPMPARTVPDEDPDRAEAPAPVLETSQEAPSKRSLLEDSAALENFMVDFVVEQTGYPREVVELDADLEADLGIDSIKKAQLFAELRDYFDIHPNGTSRDLTLDDFPTLRHVVNFIQKTAAKTASPASPETMGARNGIPSGVEPDTVGPETAATDAFAEQKTSGPEATERLAVLEDPQALEAFVIDFVVEQTGYPREVVELDADLEADLGIDSIKKAQLFAELRDYFEIHPNVTPSDLTLDDFPTLRHVVNFMQQQAGSESAVARGVRDSAAADAPRQVAIDEPGGEERMPLEAAAQTPNSELDGVNGVPAGWEASVFDLVVERTGCSREAVELDADLEADLGIDPVQRGELIAALCEHFEVDRNVVRTELEDFSTLRHATNAIQRVQAKSRKDPAARRTS